MSGSTTLDQWIRKWSLVAYDASGSNIATQISAGTDEPGQEQLRIVFIVKQATGPVPNTATIRVYNPSDNLVTLVKNQYQRITLAAGYANGRYGTLFDGTIKQIIFGAETAVDHFVEIDAADGDLGFNNATINKVVSGSANNAQGRMRAIAQALIPWGVEAPDSTLSQVPDTPINPRSTVLFGMASDFANVHANSIFSNGQPMEWSIQNGRLTLVPSNAAISDNTQFIINSMTGMVGFPSISSDGLDVRTLLNPSYGIRRSVLINNAQINQTVGPAGTSPQAGMWMTQFPGPGSANWIMDVSADGTYLIYVIEHSGDTRGNDWYSDLVLVTANAQGQVTTAHSGIPTGPTN